MKKLLFIYNPNAGKGKINTFHDDIIKIFRDYDWDVTDYATKAPLDGKNHVAEYGTQYDRVVCYGGDGTLSEISAGCALLENAPEIGFIPAGSANDTAKSYGLPMDISEAAAVAASGKVRYIDLGKFNDKNFIYVASFGEISAVSAFTDQKLKKNLGYAAYIIEGAKTLPKIKAHPMVIEHDGVTTEGKFYLGMVTNSFQVGGFKGITGKSVDLSDGLFEVILFCQPRDLRDFITQVGSALIKKDDETVSLDSFFALQSKNRNEPYDVLVKFKAKDIAFKSDDDIQWVTDGEDAGKHKEAYISALNKEVKIVLPE